MDFLYLIFYACLRLGFWMWRQTRACGVLFTLSADYSVVMYSAVAGNLSYLTVASSRHDILLCSQTLVSDMRHVSELLAPGFRRPVLLCLGAGCLGHEGWQHMYEMVIDHFANPSLSVVVAKCWFLEFVVRDRTYICSVFTAAMT